MTRTVKQLFDLTGQTALVTGGSRGLGLQMAHALGEAGARVMLSSRKADDLQEAVAELKAAGIEADFIAADCGKEEDIRRLAQETVKKMGRIDILINNAGALVQRVPIEEITDELFDNVVYLNVRSAMMCSAAAVKAMRQQGQGGVLINVTSVAARHGGGAGASLYAGSKGFVSTMTRGLAKELVKDNIRVNAVAPGVITTPFHERFSTPQMLEGFRATIPMNRLGTAEECAGAFVYLASEQMSGYVTGQIIEVNGGQYMP